MAKTGTIEQRVAQTILQKATEITVGDKTYSVAPPTTATLILVSEAVSQLPHLKLDEKNIVGEVLSVAKDCSLLGDVAAILILGAKGLTETVTRRRRFVWPFNRLKVKETIDRKAELSREILETHSPSSLHNLIATLLGGLDLADFFALTTFLTEVNLLRQTKVETETTAFGQ